MNQAEQRIPEFKDALFTMLLFAGIMFFFLVKLEAPPHIPMLLGSAVASAAAIKNGRKWKEIEKGMVEGISQALVSVIILFLIGILIGIWIQSGVVPAMIYYGMQLLSQRLFLPSAMLICAMISMILGSWGTAGTIGLAFMGIGQIMQIPMPIVAGAIISGAYMGDKISPFSDSTNLASSVTGVDIFENVKYMIPISGSAFLISGVLFTVMGWKYGIPAGDGSEIMAMAVSLKESFSVSAVNFLPLIFLILCILFKVPSIPSIFVGIVSAAVIGVVLHGVDLESLVQTSFYGYEAKTGDVLLDNLLSAGGIESMMYSISLIMCAMTFGGIMENTGLMQSFMEPMVKHIKGRGSIIAATVLSCMTVNVCLPEQYVAIALPGKMFGRVYDEKGISRKDLSRALGAGGAAFSPIVPWNTCGVFMAGVLGVSTIAYGRYAFLNYLTPIIVIAVGFVFKEKKS